MVVPILLEEINKRYVTEQMVCLFATQTYVRWPQRNEKKQRRFLGGNSSRRYVLQLTNLNMMKTTEIFLQHKSMPLDLLCKDTPTARS